MKVFVAGAHGQVGQHLVARLLDNDDTVIGGYRDPSRQAGPSTAEFTPVAFDLTAPVATLAQAMAGAEAVIFAAGSQGKDLLAVDLDGAVKTMEAAAANGISRFILLSAFAADDRTQWPAPLTNYYIAKHYADEWLRHRTTLDYVIVQPTTLTNAPAAGTISLAPAHATEISRADVATVLAASLVADLHRETLKITGGSIPIAQAF
ncbi:SDR family oxidoreductase [Lacticaseibacillus daqingensis]|uniref:SDR family oxidoreductase n=1 Tax=Lacticaseibacillus daqingensis TaxID=2486014 RepID=UPI000F7660E0|nr:SDR family oxidoreductase [Lacticaseibacillus daqingensis]